MQVMVLRRTGDKPLPEALDPVQWRIYASPGLSRMGEQSRYSNHPRAHTVMTVKLGRMTTRKNPPTPTPGHAAEPGLIVLIRPLRPHYSRNPLMLPFNSQVCHERPICLRFHWILKVVLEMSFLNIAHRFESWIEFLWPLFTLGIHVG